MIVMNLNKKDRRNKNYKDKDKKKKVNMTWQKMKVLHICNNCIIVSNT